MKAGAPEPELLRTQPPLPPEFAHLVATLGQFPAPLDWTRIESWTRLTRRPFARWELDVLAHADRKRQT